MCLSTCSQQKGFVRYLAVKNLYKCRQQVGEKDREGGRAVKCLSRYPTDSCGRLGLVTRGVGFLIVVFMSLLKAMLLVLGLFLLICATVDGNKY